MVHLPWIAGRPTEGGLCGAGGIPAVSPVLANCPLCWARRERGPLTKLDAEEFLRLVDEADRQQEA